MSLPAPWPRVLPPASRVLCRPEGWWEGRAPVSPCSSCKASSLLRHGGSRQPFSRMHDGRRPGVRRSARRAHGSAAGKRSLALQRQPRGLRGARASLPSPDLLNPSFRVGQVGRGSWALAFGSRWHGGHPAACPAPGRLRAAQLGRPRGEERGLWFAALSLSFSLSFAGRG